MAKKTITLERLAERLVEVFGNADLLKDYKEDSEISVCFGWDGDVMSPLSRVAYIKDYGEELVTKAEEKARAIIADKAKKFTETCYHSYEMQANEHMNNGQPVPTKGIFVWALNSGLKCEGGFPYALDNMQFLIQQGDDAHKQLVQVAEVHELPEEVFAPVSGWDNESALADIITKAGEGTNGSKSDDVSDEECASYTDYCNLEDWQKKTFYTLGIAITCGNRWYIVDSEGYSYSRYILLPLEWKTMFKKELTASNNQSTNNQNSETMATTIKAADLIGKTIKAGENCQYVVKSVEGDKLTTEFTFGSHKPMTCPIPLSQVQKMVDEGKWSISGQGDEVQGAKSEPEKPTSEVQGDKVQGTKSEPEKPKAKTEPKAKPKKTKQEVKGNYTYATYVNKKGKKCAKIVGVTEAEEAYTHAAELHASGSFERDKQGNKQFYLCFGPRYADAAKAVCDAMNAGKSLADCKAIIDKQTAENAQKREEWKAKRAERAEQANVNSNGYTVEQVAAMLHSVMNGGELPDDIKAAMKKAA